MEQVDGGQQSIECFDAIMKELTKIKTDYVVTNKDWYRNHSRPQLLFFGDRVY